MTHLQFQRASTQKNVCILNRKKCQEKSDIYSQNIVRTRMDKMKNMVITELLYLTNLQIETDCYLISDN